jgi:hypothetical protein
MQLWEKNWISGELGEEMPSGRSLMSRFQKRAPDQLWIHLAMTPASLHVRLVNYNI